VFTRRWTVSSCALIALTASSAAASNRTIDGTGNNLTPIRTTWGAANTDVIRFGYAADYPDGYGDQIYGPTTSPARPNARDISNALFAQSSPLYNNRNLSDWVVQWGQFLTHDMDLTGTSAANNVMFAGGTGDYRIPINDPNDPLGPNPISFNRSNYNPTTGNTTLLPAPGGTRPNWREQINSVTSYIDASQVYGSDAVRAAALRTFIDGKLVTSAGGLLPGLNSPLLANDDPFHLGAAQFLAGDVRANEQVGLTAAHALFVREHNRLAGLLKTANPSFTDETIYQTARKIVGAEMQAITYKEFLPALMGASRAPDANAYAYDNTLNASITNSFATAFFRFGHSMQSSAIPLIGNDGLSAGNLSLRDAFFNPSILQSAPEKVDLVLKGLATQVAQENDVLMVDDLRNFLFGPPSAGGLDLAALDIQRGRDHGLLGFNAMRTPYNLMPLMSINQITTNATLRAALVSLYGNVNNIDAFVGALAENHVAGASVGSMLIASFTDQFTRLRDGDRFFYTGDPDLQTATVTSVINLNTITLADIIRLNTGVTNIQNNVFVTTMSADFNASNSVNSADLTAWASTGGDADHDGDSDGADFLLWQQQFGAQALAAEAAATAVPEPTTLAILLPLTAMRRVRRKSASLEGRG
jgi:hypothetical protein